MYGAFSHDVMAAILVFQNNETAAMLVYQTNPVGIELFSYVKTFFSSNKFAWLLATCVKMLYISTAFNKRLRWFEYAYCDSSTFRVVPVMKAVSE